MIILENLIVKNNILNCFYRSLDETGNRGKIEYDITNKELITYELSGIDNNYSFKPYLNKSLRAIETLIKYNKFPETYHYSWY